MKRIIGSVVLLIAVMFVLVGCGGGGIGTPANATPPTLLNAGVAKDVWIYFGQSGSQNFSNFTGDITVSGNTISLTYNGKNQVFVGATMFASER